MRRTIEELLNTPFWIIDILPKQVPQGSTGQYFAVERYLRETQLSEIKRKHVNMILKLNCYRDISLDDSLDEEGILNPSPDQIADVVNKRYVNIMIDDAMIISEPEDTHMTIFNPDDDLLALVRELAFSEGMFVWKTEG